MDVKNTGSRAGAEVAQLYLGLPAETSEPPKQLKGFQKLTLQPGETQTATLTLTPAEYSFWSAGLKQWTAYPGEYQVFIGSSVRDIKLNGTFTVNNTLFNGEHIPAARAKLAGGVTHTSEGFLTGFQNPGDFAAFTVTAPEAGEHTLTIRYASALRPGGQNAPRTLSLYVNGVKQKQIQFPNLANWEMWDFEAETVALNSGENTITYQFDPEDNGDVHLDTLILSNHPEPNKDAPNILLPIIIALATLGIGAALAVFQWKRKNVK